MCFFRIESVEKHVLQSQSSFFLNSRLVIVNCYSIPVKDLIQWIFSCRQLDQHLCVTKQPLLVFVNVKSGGCQGLELITAFRKQLNPYQVYDLENGGPLPG